MFALEHVGVVPLQFAEVLHVSHLPVFVPVVTQTPLWQSAVEAHVPSPRARPHLLFSQEVDVQKVPAVAHVPM